MKRKSPISVDRVQFYVYGPEDVDDLVFIDQFEFDNRRDFPAHGIAGIAVKSEISNFRIDKGARRLLGFTLVDMTNRCVIAEKDVRFSVRADWWKDAYVYFSADAGDIEGGRTYKLIISDITSGETLTEEIFHLFDDTVMGHPANWYEVCDGGIRMSWNQILYKSLYTKSDREYTVQFNIAPNMGAMYPPVLPEVEIRIHYPDGKYVRSYFREPVCTGMQNYQDNIWTAECPLETTLELNGVFYAELLCMEYPIGGFVFDTNSEHDITGKWFAEDIKPLDHYSLEAAEARIDGLLPDRNKKESDDGWYEELLSSLKKELGNEE